MSPLSNARSIFAVVFLFVLAAGSGVNAILHGGAVLDAMRAVSDPVPPRRAGDGFRRAAAAAERRFLGQYHAKSMRARFMVMLDKREMNNFAVIKGPDNRLYHGGLFQIHTENAGKLAKSIENFVESAREKGIPAFDSRYAYLSDGFPVDDISPRTATLLTGKGAFALFAYLLDALEHRFGLVLDGDGYSRDWGNYKVRTYPRFFMGALGHETGPAFSGLDDFTTMAPGFETEYAIEGVDMFDAEIRAKGNAEQTVIKPGALLYYDNIYTLYPESYYVHANMSWSSVLNLRNPNGPKCCSFTTSTPPNW